MSRSKYMPEKGDIIFLTDHEYIEAPEFIKGSILAQARLFVVSTGRERFRVRALDSSPYYDKGACTNILSFMVEYSKKSEARDLTGSLTIEPS
jgi:ssRNA-specific RNase YbeY (16S rRNA maturation enzyme)